MLDGLGLAETTPGPLILVTEFVGFLAGYRHGGEPKLAFGLLGALVTLWATFAPCFLWIFVGAPYIERLEASPRLGRRASAVTAAVVGVILNLSLWFALHVFFAKVEPAWLGPLRLWLPDVSTLDLKALVLAALAALLLLRLKLGIAATLAISASAALAWFLMVRSVVSLQRGNPEVHERRPHPGAVPARIDAREGSSDPGAAPRIHLGERRPDIVAGAADRSGDNI